MTKISAYHDFLKEIKERIRSAQYDALKVVNKEMIRLYWDIGKKIVEEQERHGWGKAVVVNLARDLQAEFPGISGYSADNLWRMRKFYLHFRENPKLAPLVQEISWTKIIVILEGCKDDLEMEFGLIPDDTDTSKRFTERTASTGTNSRALGWNEQVVRS